MKAEQGAMFIFKLLKWIFGIASGALSILLMVYLGLKDDAWRILASDGQVVVDKSMGIGLIAVWAVAGLLFLIFEFLYKKTAKNRESQ